MGTPKESRPAKYFVALLLSDANLLTGVEKELTALFSAVDGRSELTPWAASKFYEQEMGQSLQPQEIEESYRDEASKGRRVNLDPGYWDSFKVVLASTKNAGQRIYLDGDVYAKATLMYHDGGFQGLPYTYPDYLWPESLDFLTRLRAVYLEQLRQAG